jgi:chromosome partitioning protein
LKTLAIANHKGGVGKTATAHALGVAMAQRKRRVLLVDLDPQGSLTGSAGLADFEGLGVADVIGVNGPGRTALAEIVKPLSEGLHLAPTSLELARVELGLFLRSGREAVLRRALASAADTYDLVIIDCPPSLGLLTVNALAAADAVLIPTQPQAVDLRALRLFLETLDNIRAELNPGLQVLGVLPTFYNARLTHHTEALQAMRGAGLPVLPVAIGRSIRLAEAAAAGESVITFAADNPQAQAYQQLAEIVHRWLRKAAT